MTRFFKNRKEIDLYRCNDTGYRYYSPLDLGGDSSFYEHFQKFDWYYMPWKWEHEVSLDYITDGQRLLEVGCGQGAFIEKVTSLKNVTCTGLELNETSARQGNNFAIVNEKIEEHAASSRN